MNCNVEITAVGTADGLEVSIHGGSVGMMTAAELIVARVLMAVADDEENLAGLKDSMFEIINEMGVGHYFLAVGAKLMRHEIADPMATSPQATLPRSGLVLCAQPVPQGLHAEPDSSGGQ